MIDETELRVLADLVLETKDDHEIGHLDSVLFPLFIRHCRDTGKESGSAVWDVIRQIESMSGHICPECVADLLRNRADEIGAGALPPKSHEPS